jgi:hypothetical protein
LIDQGKPVLVKFQTPWPLLKSSSGLEARDLRNSESAFLQVLPINDTVWIGRIRKVFKALLMGTVLSSQGKFGAYGAPIDIKVKPVKDFSWNADLFSVTFASYTPAMRESERQLWIALKQVDGDTLVALVVGTTKARFASQEPIFSKVIQSYSAVEAPESSFRRGSDGGGQ